MTTYKIVAATGCPTGIAHTYMAQEALEQAAKRKGISIKVETHGQVGIENQLTPEEIKNADAVIIAADKDVQAERFAGKRVITVPVSKGIKDADQLIEEALMKGSITAENQTVDAMEKVDMEITTGIGHSIYKNLMNGVSHMLPFVVAGGVIIAISFAIWGVYSFDPNDPTYNSTAAMLKGIGDTAMGMMVPILAAYIAEGIAKRPGLVVGFVGGLLANAGGAGFLGGIFAGFLAGYFILLLQKVMKGLPKQLDGLKAIFLYPVIGVLFIGVVMTLLAKPMEAINQGMMDFLSGFQNSNPLILGIIVGCMSAFDMGGPVNKAAYVTGTALLAQGNHTFMAGVSAACIAPPLITGFAALLFGKYFDTNDRNAGLVNFILGSTHITEGAIPFAAKDPLRVLPTMMLGSSIAAVLTYMFGVQVPAPHGGFLVLPVVTGKVAWVGSILLGSIVGGVILGLIQKRSVEKREAEVSAVEMKEVTNH
ncbi:PTS system fructose-specific family, IIBC component [Enterococcus sp. 10A9_DIV0425]|uniref:PTS system fructose-specific family, IIBC component n=1 Tax=Candidatus Enterococcus wittei TaxID=1987383 RepID=A0A242K0D8_9ENTE|nr:PTS fructose transporter subunit IIBC [Enterococcus sp. 10A9_DIV0425]OTP11127.1 PTS system fructose-specific family, IIBC component [Enterococcus sp. 10A9_DIV0425]